MINQTHREKIYKINALPSTLKKPVNIRLIILKKNILGKINDKFLTQYLIKKKRKKRANKPDLK